MGNRQTNTGIPEVHVLSIRHLPKMSVEERCPSLLVSVVIVLVAFTPTAVGQGPCSSASLIASTVVQNLTSPNYPDNYPINANCVWNIQADTTSHVIVLNVFDFITEGCNYDVVTIYDGSSTSSPTLSTLCGTVSASLILSSGPYLTVGFVTDGSGTLPGFEFEFISMETSDSCSSTSLIASEVVQNLTSPNYPSNYPNSVNCHWIITSDSPSNMIVLNVFDFQTEGCTYDYVAFYDGTSTSSPVLRKLCGVVSGTQIIGTGSYMTVVFHSDSSNNYPGFSFNVNSLETSDICSNVQLVATERLNYITSPGYQNIYLSHLACQWTITADSISRVVVLKLEDFYVEGSSPSCYYDYLEIYDGGITEVSLIQKLCGLVTSGQFISSGQVMTVTFHSDESNNYRGFNLQYTSTEKSGLCSNVALQATANVNYITSPNYPGNYTRHTNCQWSIEADSSSRVVVLKLFDFHLEADTSCRYDYVAVYDGYSINSDRLQLLCGQLSDIQIISTGPYMTIVFHSDWAENYRGFKLEYTSQEKSALCENVTLSATEIVNYITSPDYPMNYPSNSDCQWSIQADSPTRVVVLNVLDFDVEGTSPSCEYDYVSIYDGPSTDSTRTQLLCGQAASTQFTSSGRSVTVVFHSDRSNNFKGFKIEYNSHEAGSCSNANLTASGTAQYITSPGYPNNYPSHLACEWIISTESSSGVVVLKLLDFVLEDSTSCVTDYVAIYDGSSTNSPMVQMLCGDVSSSEFISTGPVITVEFTTDGSGEYKGFKFEFTSMEKSVICANVSLTATATSDYIISPGYPNNYLSDMSCQWSISADTTSRVVVLKVLDFQLEGSSTNCTFDYVAVYDGPSTNSPRIELLCGQVSSREVISTGSLLTVVFYSDGSSNFNGFKLEYNSQESALCTNVALTANGTTKYITSPGYPNIYPSNMGCQWTIEAESLSHVVTFSLADLYLEGTMPACSYDFIEIYDGPSITSPRTHVFCGQEFTNQAFSSSGSFLTIVFRTDGAINFKGFKLEYSSS